jgi:hypothetical protein
MVERTVLEMRATANACLGSMNDDLIGLRDLAQRRAAMAELAAGLESRLLSQAAGAPDLFPREVERRRQGGVMRVVLNRLLDTALDLESDNQRCVNKRNSR